MINHWEVALNGYKAPIVRKIAGDIEEKTDKPIGESRRYTKKKLEFWSKGGGNRLNCQPIVIKAFVEEKLSAHEICDKYGFTYNYVRAVLVANELVEAGTKNGKKAVVIIDSHGRVTEYESAILAMQDFGLAASSFRKHLYKKGNVGAKNGKVAMFKKDYLELGRGNK